MAPLPEHRPAALMLAPVVWPPSPSSPDRIRDPRASNRAAPCPRPTALSPCRLYRTNSRDKRSSLADLACLGGKQKTVGSRQWAVGRKRRHAARGDHVGFLPSAFCLLLSAFQSSTS